jgi:hypothetical protein
MQKYLKGILKESLSSTVFGSGEATQLVPIFGIFWKESPISRTLNKRDFFFIGGVRKLMLALEQKRLFVQIQRN